MNDLVIGLIVIGFILFAVGIGAPIFAWWIDNKAEDWVQTVQKFFRLKPNLANARESRRQHLRMRQLVGRCRTCGEPIPTTAVTSDRKDEARKL